MSDRDDALRARLVEALDNAHKTQPCTCGSTIWSTCGHRGAPSHSERRADAVLAVLGDDRGEQLEQARRIAVELENENARLTDELNKYVGKEPTVAEEMQHLNRCLNAVYDLCEQAKKNAGRWENPLPVPEWVDAVEQAADGQRPDNPDDNRRRIYLDVNGRAWISACTDHDGTEYVVEIDEAAQEERPVTAVRAETGNLREIGRTW